MSPSPSLEDLQRWMLAVITDPRGIDAGVGSESARRHIAISTQQLEQVIPRSTACTSTERLAVYGYAYFARLLECLQAEYSILARAAGETAFQSLAADYLLAHPPRSYTLGRLGAELPRYLAESRPARGPDSAAPDWADFLIDLARLERTYTEVFDGPGEEGEPPPDARSLSRLTANDESSPRLTLTRSLRIQEFRFPVHETYSALRSGQAFTPPAARSVTLAVSRCDFVVQRREISPPQATLLIALQSGESLADAIERTVMSHELDVADLPSRLQVWFQDWTAAGIVRGVEASR